MKMPYGVLLGRCRLIWVYAVGIAVLHAFNFLSRIEITSLNLPIPVSDK